MRDFCSLLQPTKPTFKAPRIYHLRAMRSTDRAARKRCII
ncbi:MAG: hypothetical protein K0R12_276 [Gammaproteobacteria bacterium]|jgi:hypothetical protein|nr:hypothetical protein [Gammaproteobacteria bacterium]